MRVQTHMYAVVAGVFLMTLVGTSAMGGEPSKVITDHAADVESTTSLGETSTPFLAMQNVSATPMSDEALAEVRGTVALPSWVPLIWRLPMSHIDGNNIYVTWGAADHPHWINCNFVKNGC